MFIDLQIIGKLGGAFLLALPIAYDREKAQRAAGIRTFPLVSITACGFIMIGLRFLGENSEANARLMQGIIGGLGFLGGGAILKGGGSVRGMATAATIWSAGAIGMASAYGEWEVAFMLMLATLITLQIGSKMKNVLHDQEDADERPDTD